MSASASRGFGGPLAAEGYHFASLLGWISGAATLTIQAGAAMNVTITQ